MNQGYEEMKNSVRRVESENVELKKAIKELQDERDVLRANMRD